MKKLLSLFTAAVVMTACISCFAFTAGAASFSGYTKISSASDLMKMNGSTGKFYLTKDIDLKSYNWTPIDFSGTFDGNGFVIRNLKSTYGGLFKELTPAGKPTVIRNLGLENVNVTSSNSDTGGLANSYNNKADLTIENCYVTGKVTNLNTSANYNSCGGILGGWHSNGGNYTVTIKKCFNQAAVTSNYSAGGIIGYLGSVAYTFTDCANSGTIKSTGVYEVGGIVGFANKATLKNCLNTGKVSGGKASCLGGIAGVSSGSLTSCYTVTDPVAGTLNFGSSVKSCATGSGSAAVTIASGVSVDAKTGVSKSAFKKQSTYKGFNFKSTWMINADANNGYPILQSVSKLYKLKTTTDKVTAAEITVGVKKGGSVQLNAGLTPSGSTAAVSWSSSKTSVAIVDKNGKVTGKAAGTAVITMKAGGITKKITVVVT